MLNDNEELLVLPDVSAAARTAADRVAEILSAPGKLKNVALAGGKTPAAMYELLAESPGRQRLDWTQVDWFWGDERCVPSDHPDSNFRMALQTLLNPLGIPAERIHRMPADSKDLDAAAREHEATIRAIVPAGPDGLPVFDLILLGIGSDGHTASLFPGSAGLAERQRLVVAHHAHAPNAMRMTMTYPLLWAARNILFLACGPDKADAIKRIFASSIIPAQPAPAALPSAATHFDPPAAGIRAGRSQITWILDTPAAASLLPTK